jgi:hypothetical protein
MVPSEYLDLLAALKHNVDDRVEILGLLRFLPHLRKQGVPTDALPHLDPFGRTHVPLALVTHQTDLVGMHKIIPVSEVDLLVLQLDPHDLLHQLVTPPLHNLY